MKPSKDMRTLRRYLQRQFRKNRGREMSPRQLTAATLAVSGKLTETSVDDWLKGQVIRHKKNDNLKIKPFLVEVDI